MMDGFEYIYELFFTLGRLENWNFSPFPTAYFGFDIPLPDYPREFLLMSNEMLPLVFDSF